MMGWIMKKMGPAAHMPPEYNKPTDDERLVVGVPR